MPRRPTGSSELVSASAASAAPFAIRPEFAGVAAVRPVSAADSLARLPGRAALLERLDELLAYEGGTAAVVFIDLDDFKDIVEGHGNRVADEVLAETARRLADVVRPLDTVGRLGGDEFVILCTGLATQGDAARVAGRLLTAIAAPIAAGNDEVVVTASIGISFATAGVNRADDVLHEADSAMYRAKARGKNQIDMFDDVLRETANQRMSVEALLRRALDENLFRLHYQPIYELATGDLMGIESLIRLEDPDQGLLSPAIFIDIAEQSGLIVPIGAWVLSESCRQLAQWKAAGDVCPQVRIAVNLSARQVSRSDLLKTVSSALTDAGLQPHDLSLELTESIFMDADSAHVRQLEALRSMGVTIEIDDFGTGYSSLAYLKRLPVGVVKVDQSFVAGMLTSAADYGIVNSIIGLGQALGLTTIAEGVETAEQLDALWVLGCDQVQGYHLGRPCPPLRPPLAVTDWGEPGAQAAAG
jgi:diguanylate cyclase (GGDEF)-like protein